jgi:hypothetical protein
MAGHPAKNAPQQWGHAAKSGKPDIARVVVRLGRNPSPFRLTFRVPAFESALDSLSSAKLTDTESTSLQIMACRGRIDATSILRSQQRSGAWSALPVSGPENCFHTALALLALRASTTGREIPLPATRAFAWLDLIAGVEDHWLWKWKFRYFDRQVRFDPTKTGWPWVEGTVSWVAPTAMVILAHRAWARESRRLAKAVQMLLDRACPQGGWNAGNSEVFGVALDPHPDFTAMALLALQGRAELSQPNIAKSLDYLSLRLKDSRSLYSLGWAALALGVWGHPECEGMLARLRRQLISIDPASVTARALAIAILACDPPPFLKPGGRP